MVRPTVTCASPPGASHVVYNVAVPAQWADMLARELGRIQLDVQPTWAPHNPGNWNRNPWNAMTYGLQPPALQPRTESTRERTVWVDPDAPKRRNRRGGRKVRERREAAEAAKANKTIVKSPTTILRPEASYKCEHCDERLVNLDTYKTHNDEKHPDMRIPAALLSLYSEVRPDFAASASPVHLRVVDSEKIN